MKNFILAFLALCLLSSCMTKNERLASQTLRNIHTLTLAVKDPEAKVSAAEAIIVIEKASIATATIIDPTTESPATVTISNIIDNKKESFKKIVIDASTVPATDWGWLTTLGGGLLLAVGLLGKMMGPPYNLGGMALESLGRRLVPKYEETKKVAVGMLVAMDSVLTSYGELLDTMPEVKKSLAEKLGQDPVKWFKIQIQRANTDNGTEPAVSEMLTMVKRHLTTEDGSLAPEMVEVDKFLNRSISNMRS